MQSRNPILKSFVAFICVVWSCYLFATPCSRCGSEDCCSENIRFGIDNCCYCKDQVTGCHHESDDSSSDFETESEFPEAPATPIASVSEVPEHTVTPAPDPSYSSSPFCRK